MKDTNGIRIYNDSYNILYKLRLLFHTFIILFSGKTIFEIVELKINWNCLWWLTTTKYPRLCPYEEKNIPHLYPELLHPGNGNGNFRMLIVFNLVKLLFGWKKLYRTLLMILQVLLLNLEILKRWSAFLRLNFSNSISCIHLNWLKIFLLHQPMT